MSGTYRALKPESFVPLLDAIRHILLKHEFIGQARLVGELIDLAHSDPGEFAEELGRGGMWGSAGSVADVVGLRHSLEPADAETERDSIELRRNLIRLADQMEAQGISTDASDFVANGLARGLGERRLNEP